MRDMLHTRVGFCVARSDLDGHARACDVGRVTDTATHTFCICDNYLIKQLFRGC